MRILLDVLDGVIETDNPVTSTIEVEVVENVSVFVALTTCKTLPAGKLDPILADVNTVPLVVGKVSVVVPDTAGAANVTLPDVEPLSIRLAISYYPLDI